MLRYAWASCTAGNLWECVHRDRHEGSELPSGRANASHVSVQCEANLKSINWVAKSGGVVKRWRRSQVADRKKQNRVTPRRNARACQFQAVNCASPDRRIERVILLLFSMEIDADAPPVDKNTKHFCFLLVSHTPTVVLPWTLFYAVCEIIMIRRSWHFLHFGNFGSRNNGLVTDGTKTTPC